MVRGRVPQPTLRPQNKKAAKDNGAALPALSQTATASASTANRGSGKSTARHNVPSCNSCGTVITEETKALQCDKCQSKESWKCADCLNLSGNVYETLLSENGPPLRWFCDECDVGWNKSSTENIMSVMSKILNKLDQLQDKVERIESKFGPEVNSLERQLEGVAENVDGALVRMDRQLKTLENKVELITDTMEKTVAMQGKVDETVHKRLEDKVDGMMKAIGNQQLQAVQGVVQGALDQDRAEELEIEQRKRNVIVHGVAESMADSSDQEWMTTWRLCQQCSTRLVWKKLKLSVLCAWERNQVIHLLIPDQ